ncbi:MAG: Gfo/Idh/MocA family oxidoreductase [Oligoflexia bacterium]|nr:Gfo/Idh/MocA family oxidoreductase [Oligoflexia bacterium]
MNIAIIGGGNSARRFTEALVFGGDINPTLVGFAKGKTPLLANQYGLNFIDEYYFWNECNSFDLIIIATTPGSKLDILERLISKKYSNAIIFEKPLSTCPQRAKKIFDLVKDNNIRSTIAYSRQFLSQSLVDLSSNFKNIEWPYCKSSGDPIVHQLPHILHLIAFNAGLFLKDHSYSPFEVTKIKYNNGDYQIFIKFLDNSYEINLYNSESPKMAKIDGNALAWPNYLQSHLTMIKFCIDQDGFNYDFRDKVFNLSVDIAKQISDILKIISTTLNIEHTANAVVNNESIEYKVLGAN